MRPLLLTLSGFFIVIGTLSAQLEICKNVISAGGIFSDNGTFQNIAVVGEPVVSTNILNDCPDAVQSGFIFDIYCRAEVTTLSTSSAMVACKDGVADMIEVENSPSNCNLLYLIVDSSEEIVDTFSNGQYDFDPLDLGDYHIHGLSYTGDLDVAIGMMLNDVSAILSPKEIAPINCFELSSNSLTITVSESAQSFRKDTICQGEMLVIGDSTYFETGEHVTFFSNQMECDSTVTTDLIVVDLATMVITEDATCQGADGIARIDTTGLGTGVLSFEWTTGMGVDTVGNLMPGSYEVTITDVLSQCKDTLSFDVGANSNGTPTADAGSPQTIECFGQILNLDGSNSSAGSNYDYLWETGDGNIVSGSSGLSPEIDTAGDYSLIVTNTDNDCKDTALVTVNIDTLITTTADAGIDGSNCEQNYELDAVSFSGGVSAEWLVGVDNYPFLSGEAVTINDLQVGANEVVLSFSTANCSDFFQDTVTITISGEDTVAISPVICQGDSVKVGNTFYSSAGIFSEMLTNINGCDSLVQIDLTVVDLQTQGDKVDATCKGDDGSIDLSVLGGLGTISYEWSAGLGSTAFVDNLSPNSYSVTVTDESSQCKDTLNFVVDANLNGKPIADAGSPQILDCFGQVLNLDGSNSSTGSNYIYLWETGNGNIVSGATGLMPEIDAAGDYTIIVTNTDNDCRDTALVMIAADPLIATTADAGIDSSSCEQGYELDAVSFPAGVTAEWLVGVETYPFLSGEAITINDLQTGDNQVVLSFSTANCSDFFQDALTITVFEKDTVSKNEVICQGESYMVGSMSFSTTGMHEDTLTNINGCDSLVQLDLTVVDLQIQADTMGATCKGNDGSINLNVSGGLGTISYEWSSGLGATAFVDNLLPDSYSVTITDEVSQCKDTLSFDVEVNLNNGNPEAVIDADQFLECFDISKVLDGTNSSTGGSIVYQWTTVGGNILSDPNSISVDIDKPGNYTLTVTNMDNDCMDTSMILIAYEDAILETAVAGPDDEICETDFELLINNIPVGVNAALIYPVGILNPIQPGVPITLFDLEGGANNIVLSFSTPACPNFSQDSFIVTVDEFVPLAIDDSYQMFIGTELSDINVLQNDEFSNGSNITVEVIEQPFGGDLTSNGNGRFTYVPPPTKIGGDNFIYRLCNEFCQDEDHCSEATVSININGEKGKPVSVILTLNDDGMNDTFVIEDDLASKYPNNELLIFNRWGSLVYTAEPYDNEWRGQSFNGKILPEGTYYYRAALELENGNIKFGSITLIKD